jgi:hypothetical protein
MSYLQSGKDEVGEEAETDSEPQLYAAVSSLSLSLFATCIDAGQCTANNVGRLRISC